MAAPYPATAPPRFAGYGEDAGLELPELGPTVEREIIQRLTSRTFDDWAEAAARVGYCSRPIRIRGSSTTIDSRTGEVLSTYDSAREPFGVLHLRCGDRRVDRCPSCSRVYAADTFHLIRSGVAGGKGVPTTVARNPLVFATLTAPSFGHVHGQRANGRRCRLNVGTPRRCPHGRKRTCVRVHADDDPLLGQPLCRDCYDYTSQVVWQWWAPELWRRFTIALRRLVARALGVSASALRSHATVQYAKVAEYQLRGVIHFHALIRIDGPRSDTGFAPGPPTLDAATAAALVREAAAAVRFTAPPVRHDDVARTLAFGVQVDTRPVHVGRRPDDPDEQLEAEQVAGYLAKYSTKAATRSAGGDATNAHLTRLRTVTRDLAVRAHEEGVEPYLLMGKWVHMLGFRGHFSSKSRRYSVTLGALRRARQRAKSLIAEHRATGQPLDLAAREAQLLADDPDDTTLVVGDWRFVAAGWPTAGDAALAEAAAARAREYAQWKAEQRKT